MAAGLSALTAFLPTITSGTVFSMRRTNNAVEASNPFVSAMNLDVAGGQVFKAGESVVNVAKEAKGDWAKYALSASENIKNMSGGLLKVAQFTADNINPLICVTSGVKIATADDPTRTAMEEVPGVVGMLFVTEPMYKKFAGINKTERVNGNLVAKEIDAKNPLYFKNNPFIEKQAAAIYDYCSVRKGLKHAPKILKGLGFVAASIFGYKSFKYAGSKCADAILGEAKQTSENTVQGDTQGKSES